jgi:hypothetical protein
MHTQDTIYKNLDNIHNSPNVIDTLVEVDRVLDRMDVYAYENWIYGEIVEGPFVERHWVELTLMYPQKMMPNPDAAMRLISNGCKVSFGKSKFKTFAKVKNPEDVVTTKDGQRIPKPVIKTVWLVTLRIPKQLLDVSEDIKDIDDVDYDSVEDAYDEELDGAQGLQNDDIQQQSNQQQTPQGGNETQEIQA